MRTYRAAIAAALTLTLALAPVAMAATSSSTMTASATVNAAISMTGIPATYDFGSGLAGEDLIGPSFTIAVASSEPAFTVTVASTNFTKGADTIQSNRLYVNVDTVQTNYAGGAGSLLTVGTTTPMVTFLKLVPPVGSPSGTYTGTLTWTASN